MMTIVELIQNDPLYAEELAAWEEEFGIAEQEREDPDKEG